MLDGKASGGEGRVLRYVAALLVVYGALGVAVHMRLFPLLAGGLGSWLGLPAASSSPASWGLLAPLEARYDALPWLPWAAWLIGVGLLSARAVNGTGRPSDAKPAQARGTGRITSWLAPAILVVLFVVAGYARMVELWPQSRGISQFPYDDEGVYAGASQLLVQGILPYRDYFFAHPPVAAISFAPAMLYHFTQWGSPASFMDARYLSVFYSLVTLVLIFFLGVRLAGLWGGAVAGALWSLDGRVVEINRKVMLDGPMVLLSCGALLLYLWVRPLLSGEVYGGRLPRRPMLVLGFAGALAVLSALTKIAGAACLLAILADLLWLYSNNRRNRRVAHTLVPLREPLGSLVLGGVVAGVLTVAPFIAAAPSQFVREIIFFQLLRPSDGLIDIPARIADITATYGNPLTPLLAAIGFVTISVIAVLHRGDIGPRASDTRPLTFDVSRSAWRAVALWTFFSLLLFTYSRSFYSHYYIQLAAPLCLLGSGVALVPGLLRGVFTTQPSTEKSGAPRWASLVPAGALLMVGAPLIAVQWSGLTSRHEDRIFEIVGRYISDAVPPGTPVLTTDEQFNFLAARPPSHNATGYLVDSYGHMIFHGLALDSRSWGDLFSAALHGQHGNDAYAVMQSAPAQADILDRSRRVPLVVFHQKGLPRLTPATISAVESESSVAEQQPRYVIYRVKRPEGVRSQESGLGSR